VTTTDAPAFRRRRRQRGEAVAAARAFAEAASCRLPVLGVAVFGSYARGDFHDDSDVDVLVVVDPPLPARPQERLELVEPRPAGVHPVVWTPQELVRRWQRRDLIAVEAVERGIWVLGTAEQACADVEERCEHSR